MLVETKRNLFNLERHLSKLEDDIYEQPPDPGHTEWAADAIREFYPFPTRVTNVLDVGCGSGFCREIFENKYKIQWTGQDFFLDGTDFTFLPYSDESFDMIFARHVLEHSPMPLITLMEWHRISRKYMLLILPSPDYWQVFGRNHYYVLRKDNWWNLFNVAGWKIIKERDFSTSDELFMKHFMPESPKNKRIWEGPPKVVEFRYLLEKK